MGPESFVIRVKLIMNNYKKSKLSPNTVDILPGV